MKFFIRSLYLGILVASMQSAANAGTGEPNACIEKLAGGRNSQNTKLSKVGLTRFFESLATYKFKQKEVGVFVDYQLPSPTRRAFLLDLKNCELISSWHVIHGGREPRPSKVQDGDPDNDGILDHCINRKGTRKYMTRPGAFRTDGCRATNLHGWPSITDDPDCKGVGLIGLEDQNSDSDQVGIKLHEHEVLKEKDYLLPVGQGCPAFAPGALESMVKQGILKGALVYLFAPQCDGEMEK